MKKTLVFLALFGFFASCKKDVNACKQYKQINKQEQLLDPTAINAPELTDTLKKYPQLQLYKFETYSNGWVARCNMFYNGLILFSQTYSLNKNYSTGAIYSTDTLRPLNLTISLTPSVTYTDAIKKARECCNFDHTCIAYSLGIYNNNLNPAVQKNYRLAWKVESDDHNQFAFIDAQSNTLISCSNYTAINWID